MDKLQLNRLKEVLEVPTKTYKEGQMVDYLLKTLATIPDVDFFADDMQNIYAIKGTLEEGEHYPMFIAHTDTVHEIVDKIVVTEQWKSKPFTFGKNYDKMSHKVLSGLTTKGVPTGIGGDDKVGIFIALEMLRVLPKVKIGLFVSEETGCHGSSQCDLTFLRDVGYAIQFDAPGDNLITRICSGTQLYEDDGDFINIALPLFEKTMGVTADQQTHPYTDISQIKRKGDFSCINFSCGYYQMHTSNEFVVIGDVLKSLTFAQELVKELGLKKYNYSQRKIKDSYFEYSDVLKEPKVYELKGCEIITLPEKGIVITPNGGDPFKLDIEDTMMLEDILWGFLTSHTDY